MHSFRIFYPEIQLALIFQAGVDACHIHISVGIGEVLIVCGPV